MGQAFVPGKALKIFKRSPILHAHCCSAVPIMERKAAPLGMLCEHLLHAQHAENKGQPFMHLPPLVNPHANEEDDEVSFDLYT